MVDEEKKAAPEKIEGAPGKQGPADPPGEARRWSAKKKAVACLAGHAYSTPFAAGSPRSMLAAPLLDRIVLPMSSTSTLGAVATSGLSTSA